MLNLRVNLCNECQEQVYSACRTCYLYYLVFLNLSSNSDTVSSFHTSAACIWEFRVVPERTGM